MKGFLLFQNFNLCLRQELNVLQVLHVCLSVSLSVRHMFVKSTQSSSSQLREHLESNGVPVPSEPKILRLVWFVFRIPVRSLEVPHLHVRAPDPRPVTILPEHCGPRGQAGIVTRDCVVIGRALTPGVIIVKL